MDKKIGKMVKDTMAQGEKIAPVKAIKLKVKFQKVAGSVEDKKKEIAKKMK